MNFFASLSHPLQAFIATLFTWAITSIGSASVFLFKKAGKRSMDALLSFAAGVMIAASFFSLLNPALDMSVSLGLTPWIPMAAGFLCGGALLCIGDELVKRKSASFSDSRRRCTMIIFSITLHNIPEGLAIGVAFGSLIYGVDGATLAAACMLALGIGIQNLPEGAAVSLPLIREGYSGRKAFLVGQLSGIVEPVAGVCGAILAQEVSLILPFMLSFAAGAMIYVVAEELIPETKLGNSSILGTIYLMAGFCLMMVLDIALG